VTSLDTKSKELTLGKRQQDEVRQTAAWRPAPNPSGSTFRVPINHNVHTLRSLADCRAIIAQAKSAKRAVVIGASFIGLETAAALRARDIECMSSRRRSARLNGCSDRSSVTPSARCTKSMASNFTSKTLSW
jgi:hypothetical protein